MEGQILRQCCRLNKKWSGMLRVLHVHQRQAFSSIPVQQVSRGHAGFKVQGPAASHWQVKGHNHFLVIKEKNISSSTTNREKLENVATQNASAQPCSEADIEKSTKVYVDEPTAKLCVDEQTFARRTVITSTESGPKPSSVDIKDPIEKRLVDFSVNSSSLADKACSQSFVDPGVSDLVQKNKRPESLEILNTAEIAPSEDLPPKRIVQPVHNFAAVVNKSETLANLVRLGVDLSQMEANRDAADLLVRLDFDEDIKPVLLFLHDVGVESDKMGTIITKYPLILRSSLEDMRTHIDYFRSKNFPAEAISYIITKAPRLFGMSVMEIDTNLGVYQQEFKLTGSEVQQVATKLPKLVSWNTGKIQDARFYMLEFLGFSKAELKQIFLTCPKVLLMEKLRLGKKFDYLYNDMKLTHKALVSWPRVFLASQMLLQQRHQFLKKLGRDQFDPTKENYVSLRDLVTRRDRDFCFHVAKSSVSQYNDFLKTL